jgi:hypothetical protein
MSGLFVLYSALAVFGIGVTIVDLFGVFEHAGQSEDNHDGGFIGDHAGDAGSDHADGASDGTEAGSGPYDDSAHSDGDAGSHGDHGQTTAEHAATAEQGYGERGSTISSADSGTRFVARTIGALRTGVYFSLGAGPTGLFAMLTGVQSSESLAWSAGAGIFIAVLARSLRAFIRKDLDSSIKASEFIMDEATITVSVMPGAMGKAAVRRYGRETEVFVRAKDPARAFQKGTLVRIVDFDDECCWVDVL